VLKLAFLLLARFKVFKTLKVQVEVFWVVTSCSVVAGYQRFRGSCCLHLQGVTVVSYHNTTRRHNTEFDLIGWSNEGGNKYNPALWQALKPEPPVHEATLLTVTPRLSEERFAHSFALNW